MFESEGDWDLDQDFLNDVDEKATEFYSQAKNSDENEPAKRPRIEVHESLLHGNKRNIWTSKQQNVKNSQTEKHLTEGADKISRTNLVLGMFGKTSSQKNDSQRSTNETTQSFNYTSSDNYINDNKNENLTRKDLVLSIFQTRNAPNKQDSAMNMQVLDVNKSTAPISNTFNLKLPQNSGTKLQIKLEEKEKKTSQSPTTPLSKSSITKNTISTTLLQDKSSNDPFTDKTRKQLVLNVLKSYTNAHSSKQKDADDKKPDYKSHHTNEKVALTRKFPGPAGLLPDKIDILQPIAYFNELQETESQKDAKASDSHLSEFCSQQTKNLFIEGAWRQMIDDLPVGFLNGHDIATIKYKANANNAQSTKVEFMAGIVESIDHSHDNPPIVLKDFSDSIQGTVHHNIPIQYPGVLEQNVVVLLHDVGMLRISDSLCSHKYHILISPSNLLGIYTNRGDNVHTTHMKTVLGSNFLNKKNTLLTNNFEKSNMDCLIPNTLPKTLLHDANDSLNLDDIQHNVSMSKETNVDNNGKKKVETLLERLKKYSPESKCTTESKGCLPLTVDSSLTNTPIDTPNSQKSKINIRSKLMQFRSADSLTPVPQALHGLHSSSVLISNDNNSAAYKSKAADDLLSINENDSDDEMLSQLDVDTILSRQN